MTQAKRKNQRWMLTYLFALIALLIAILAWVTITVFTMVEEEMRETAGLEDTQPSETVIEQTDHPIRHTYPRYDIPLDRYQQETLYNACQEWGVPYELALAVCWRETGYRDLVTTNDTGTYYGMMAVQGASAKRYMEQCGVEYLNSEEDRLRVGCCILGYYLDQYDNNIHRALMSYNAGPGTAASQWALGVYHTTYTIDIMNYMQSLME